MFRTRSRLLASVTAMSLSLAAVNHESVFNYYRHFETAKTVGLILLDYKRDLPNAHQKGAERLLELFKSNGGVYIKLGQHISSLVYLIPKEYLETLAPLQDECRPSSMQSVENCILNEFGKPIDQVFTEFEQEPIGVGSLAQVHKAKMLLNGRVQTVAVKIQHPNLLKQAADDIQVCSIVCRGVKALVPEWEFGWLVDEMETNLPIELDFSNEMVNANIARSQFKSNPNLCIPKFIYASNAVVIMEYLVGAKLTDTEKLKSWNIDGNQVGLMLSQIFNEMIFQHRFVHCDPHGGNTLVIPVSKKWYEFTKPNFKIGLLDHGLYRPLEKDFVRNYGGMWLAIITSNEAKMELYTSKLFSKKAHNLPSFHRLLSSMISARSWSAISNARMATSRANEEIVNVKEKTRDAKFLETIVAVLAVCPRDLLFIFKINDLLRAGCENLGTDNNLFAKNMMLQIGSYSMQQICTEWNGFYEFWGQVKEYFSAYLYLTAMKLFL